MNSFIRCNAVNSQTHFIALNINLIISHVILHTCAISFGLKISTISPSCTQQCYNVETCRHFLQATAVHSTTNRTVVTFCHGATKAWKITSSQNQTKRYNFKFDWDGFKYGMADFPSNSTKQESVVVVFLPSWCIGSVLALTHHNIKACHLQLFIQPEKIYTDRKHRLMNAAF